MKPMEVWSMIGSKNAIVHVITLIVLCGFYTLCCQERNEQRATEEHIKRKSRNQMSSRCENKIIVSVDENLFLKRVDDQKICTNGELVVEILNRGSIVWNISFQIKLVHAL